MAKAIQTEAETLKLLTLGRLIRGVVHELNNPVGTVLAFSQILLDEPRGPEELKALKYIEQSAQQCRVVLERLQRFARATASDPTVVDLGMTVEQAVAVCRPVIHIHPKVKVTVSPASEVLELKVDAATLSIAVTALLTQVLQSLPDATGSISVSCRSDDGRAVLEVRAEAATAVPAIDADVFLRLVGPHHGTWGATAGDRGVTYLLSFPQHRDEVASPHAGVTP